MSLNFIILPFAAHTAKKFPPDKRATERFRICHVTSHKSLWYFQWLPSTNQNLHLPVNAIQCHWLRRDNCAFYVEHSSREEPNENRQKTLTVECPFLKRGSVAVCLRSLRIRAAEEKNIPRPSKELMSCK